MSQEDFIALIEVADAIEFLDENLKNLSGMGHGGGELDGLDRLYGVLMNNAHSYYRSQGEGAEIAFYDILGNRNRTKEDRAEILLNGLLRYTSGDGESDQE